MLVLNEESLVFEAFEFFRSIILKNHLIVILKKHLLGLNFSLHF